MRNSVNFKGQVLHTRSSSKRVYWLHVEVIECSGAIKTEETISTHSRVEIISKEDESSDVLDYIRYSVKVGDVIELECWKEEVPKGKLYHTIRCTILEKYANLEPFIPIPPTQKKLDNSSLKIESEVCKYYVNSGRCHYGSNCNHYHPLPGSELKIAKEMWKRERKKSRDALADPCDPHIHGKSSHAKRADVFCDFLLETFNNFEKVLDVAGGRGEVSVNLFIRKQISTVLIDPRDDCMRPSKTQMKLLKKLGQEYSGSHLKREFPTDVVADASLIFGMHPDQATEPIFDYAIKHSISFAVVPCCVFARESPNRKLNGNPVISYEDYITYLMMKDSRIQKCFLNFDGRNQCLFMKL